MSLWASGIHLLLNGKKQGRKNSLTAWEAFILGSHKG